MPPPIPIRTSLSRCSPLITPLLSFPLHFLFPLIPSTTETEPLPHHPVSAPTAPLEAPPSSLNALAPPASSLSHLLLPSKKRRQPTSNFIAAPGSASATASTTTSPPAQGASAILHLSAPPPSSTDAAHLPTLATIATTPSPPPVAGPQDPASRATLLAPPPKVPAPLLATDSLSARASLRRLHLPREASAGLLRSSPASPLPQSLPAVTTSIPTSTAAAASPGSTTSASGLLSKARVP